MPLHGLAGMIRALTLRNAENVAKTDATVDSA
jgi:hypothetical protein